MLRFLPLTLACLTLTLNPCEARGDLAVYTSRPDFLAVTGASSLSYDATTDQYKYVWKTNKAWAQSCRQLIVKLSDGSSHVANFRFTK